MREHVFAIVAAVTTFSLLILGGVVHGTGSSLACPDWPTCHGEWMPELRGGILYEHSHRMLGALVGLLSIGLAVQLHRRRRRSPALAIAGWLALFVVIIQGVLGGVTVLFELPTAVSTAHLATAMGFFCLLLWIAWRTRPAPSEPGPSRSARSRTAVGCALALLYAQVVLGGLVRHTGAGLACPDLPLCHGQLWPTTAGVAIGAAHLHMAHRLMGVLVAVVLLVVAAGVQRSAAARASKRLAGLCIALVLLQVALGVLSVTSLLGLFEVTAHLGVGALLLGATFLLFVSLPRRPRSESRSSGFRAEGVAA